VYDVAPNEQRIVIPRAGRLTGDLISGSADNLPDDLASAPRDGSSNTVLGRGGLLRRGLDWLKGLL
jgi:hypothetical protein